MREGACMLGVWVGVACVGCTSEEARTDASTTQPTDASADSSLDAGDAQTVVDAALSPGEKTVLFVPSSAGGTEGIAIELTIPKKARFSNGEAPVVVFVDGGWGSEGITGVKYDLTPNGFIQIKFNYPGGGRDSSKSGGTFDTRGPNCIMALRDVARFALGKISDSKGIALSNYAGGVKVASKSVGLVGLSNGGNATLTTAGTHASDLKELGWIANWESPVGDGMPGGEAGDKTTGVNPAYSEATGVWDYSKLVYSAALKLQKDPQSPALTGGFFWDFNQNGQADGTDFAPLPVSADTLAYYSEGLIKAAVAKGIYPSAPPSHFVDETNTVTFWQSRNAIHHLSEVATQLPNLLFGVEASAEDHVQAASNHPHVVAQYMGLKTAGLKFVRLCADRAYVEALLGKSASEAKDNEANQTITYAQMTGLVNPESLNLTVTIPALITELADRAQAGNTEVNLSKVVTP